VTDPIDVAASEPPADDGFERSLKQARIACGWLLALPVAFAVVMAVYAGRGAAPHEEPVIVAALTIIGLTIMCSPGLVREEMVRTAAASYLASPRGMRRPQAVYGSFASAAVTAYLIAQTGALFGFICSILTVMWAPLVIGSVLSYAMWAALWPRRGLWVRWTWQAKLRRDSEIVDPDASGAGTSG
jgi:hypothetical protein